MRHIFCFFYLLLTLLTACDNHHHAHSDTEEANVVQEPDREASLALIKSLESKTKQSMMINDTLGRDLVNAYSDFAFAFASDSLAADFLFKAAEVSTAIGNYNQALVYYETITLKYASYKYIVESLYLQAHIYDEYLNDDNKAKTVYEQVIATYPNHKFAEDAKIQIGNLGKTGEQIIKEIQEKNKEKPSANRQPRLLFPSFVVADNSLIS